MELICVNCGALIADQDPVCTACGVFRGASLPPGSRDPGEPTAAYVAEPDPTEPVTLVGVVDVAITMVSVLVALVLGWLVHNDVGSIDSWMVLRSVFGPESADSLNGHDVLAMLVTFSPLAVAVLAASISRVPATGLMAAVASFAALAFSFNGPRVLGPPFGLEFDLDRDWVIVVALAGFAVADVILAFSDRGVLAGLFAGAFTGVVAAGYVLLYVQRVDALEIFDEPSMLVLLLVVPTLLLLVAGLVGGTIGALRRR